MECTTWPQALNSLFFQKSQDCTVGSMDGHDHKSALLFDFSLSNFIIIRFLPLQFFLVYMCLWQVGILNSKGIVCVSDFLPLIVRFDLDVTSDILHYSSCQVRVLQTPVGTHS